MATSIAHVKTAQGKRYLFKLCKHWSHKFEVVSTETHAEIPFDAQARAVFDADDEGLVLQAIHEDAERLEWLQGVIATHLQRFALDEPLEINWVRQD
ncbi:MAG: DUF2218 domain-containing protein [Corticimicrobacter sp.]|uniref:DUF2218 domain-containing protein n=1 Tax=Corticimicrobacter sp. TaxID=2678536 RepID=UPI0032DAC03C